MCLKPLASSAFLPAPSFLCFTSVDRADTGPNPHGDRSPFLRRELSRGGSTLSGPVLVFGSPGLPTVCRY